MNSPYQPRTVYLKSTFTALYCLFQVMTHGALDSNSNGLSDAWEKQYNQNSLFSSSTIGSFSYDADPDSDGWTNAEEAAAGTNPFDPNVPMGKVATNLVPNLQGVGCELQWLANIGKSYQVQWSDNLENWQNEGQPIIASQVQISTPVNLANSETKGFWRVEISDVDHDGDGLTNYEEYIYNTNPNTRDSDANGIADLQQIRTDLENAYPLNRDSDNDSIPDSVDADVSSPKSGTVLK